MNIPVVQKLNNCKNKQKNFFGFRGCEAMTKDRHLLPFLSSVLLRGEGGDAMFPYTELLGIL